MQMFTKLLAAARWARVRWSRWRASRRLHIDQLPPGKFDQNTVLRAMVKDLLSDRQSQRRHGNLKALLYAAMVMLPIFFWAKSGVREAVVSWFWEPDEVVAVVKLSGEMLEGSRASAERIVPAVRRAFESPRVSAVVLSIDSPGGSPLEAERIFKALDDGRAAHPKPVIAVINNVGASAAYMVAMHCDQIYAGKYSLVGSIGAIISTWDLHRALNRMEVSQRVYASGELKAMLNPYVPGSDAADRKANELVREISRQFVGDLVERRGQKLAKGVNFATGEVWGGAQALALGLVDEVGTVDQVVRSRWPNAKVKNYGALAPGALPFGEALSDWLRSTVAEALEPRVVLR